MRSAFDEMMAADIRHDLCTGQDFGMELLLNLVELLRAISAGSHVTLLCITYRLIIIHLHLRGVSVPRTDAVCIWR
jgi:hypothetical protein